MTKENLIQAIIKKTGLAKKQSAEVLSVVLEEVTKALSRGEEVKFPGFGTFKVRLRPAGERRNPKTGDKINIPATKVPKFKPGKTLKDAVK
jgi:DNA-binding protein HU-beta